jgi:Putative lactococcus lactis phage r1t holin
METLPRPKNPWGRWAFDMGERALRAYAASFVTLWTANQASADIDPTFLQTALAALTGAGVSLIFSLVAKTTGDPDTASLR